MHRLFALGIALAILVASGLIGLAAVLGQNASVASPVPADASVVAQGVAAMPAGDLAWRVTRASVAPEAALPARTTPGFVLADQGVLLINDLKAKTQQRLSAGEASFAPGRAQLEEVPLEEPLSYYRIDLVAAADAAAAGNDEIIFVGEPFASPGGSRDLDLARAMLAPGGTIDLSLQGQPAPTLLLVTAGQLNLVPASNPAAEPVPLPAGQGAALGGDVIATAADAGATYLLALVGPEAPAIGAPRTTPTPTATPEPTATPAPAVASLTLFAFACPAGYAGDQFGVDCVEPLADIPFTITATDSGATFDGATGPDGGASFGDLEPGGYAITSGVPADYVVPQIACGADSGDIAAGATEGEAAGASVTLAAGMNASCTWYAVPQGAAGEGAGTISVSVHYCPGTPVDPAADCTVGDPTGAVVAGPVVLTAGGDSALPAALGDGVVSWSGVPSGDYALQPGGIAAPPGYAISEVRGAAGSSGGGWGFTVDAANPSAALDVIYVPTVQPEGTAGPNANGNGNVGPDRDRDGLREGQEQRLGTDPRNPDTDSDGLLDGAEVAAGTNPRSADSDGDGFADNEEALARSDPNDPASVPQAEGEGSDVDTDDDGLLDSQEEELGLNPAAADSDDDGLSDAVEVGVAAGSATGTDPTNWDSDGDGVSDGTEIANGTDPIDPASA